jgi:hypothetical protein
VVDLTIARRGLYLAATLVIGLATRGGAQDWIQDQLRDVLMVDGKLSTPEVASVTADLDGIAKRGGTQEQFRDMVKDSVGEGCKGSASARRYAR